MDFLNDRRLVLALIGGALALLAGMGIAAGLLSRDDKDEPSQAPAASRGGLVVETVEGDSALDLARPLRCFVGGQFVGELTLADCAQRNGVATGSLDVGVDETGALAAADEAGTVLTPLPPVEDGTTPVPDVAVTPSATTSPAAPPQQAAAPAGTCWRYAGAEWRRLPGDLTLNACVQTLFAGRCEPQGSATYGRWMQQTLRLVPGRVEISADNRRFRPIAEQGPGCAIGNVG